MKLMIAGSVLGMFIGAALAFLPSPLFNPKKPSFLHADVRNFCADMLHDRHQDMGASEQIHGINLCMESVEAFYKTKGVTNE